MLLSGLATYTITCSSSVCYSLQERNGGDPIPLVVRSCVEYLEQEGLEVEGIFRRTTGQGSVRRTKSLLNEGEFSVSFINILN